MWRGSPLRGGAPRDGKKHSRTGLPRQDGSAVRHIAAIAAEGAVRNTAADQVPRRRAAVA